LKWAKGSYDSIRGKIEVSWRIAENKLKLDITIPANTSAAVYVPTKNAESVMEGGKAAGRREGVRFLRMESNSAVFQVQSGKYSFDAPID
jgi:alpha-L-rhamnosidase